MNIAQLINLIDGEIQPLALFPHQYIHNRANIDPPMLHYNSIYCSRITEYTNIYHKSLEDILQTYASDVYTWYVRYVDIKE